jgi:hypothetical protein
MFDTKLKLQYTRQVPVSLRLDGRQVSNEDLLAQDNEQLFGQPLSAG